LSNIRKKNNIDSTKPQLIFLRVAVGFRSALKQMVYIVVDNRIKENVY
jgi:hypothetical protein